MSMLLRFNEMAPCGTGVFVGGTGVYVGGTGVFVGGTGVFVGGTGVFVGGTGVFVGGTGVFVGGTGVYVGVGGTGVCVGVGGAARRRTVILALASVLPSVPDRTRTVPEPSLHPVTENETSSGRGSLPVAPQLPRVILPLTEMRKRSPSLMS